MTVLTEGRHTAEYLVSEANGTLSREVVTLAAGNNLTAGTVLGIVTASGKYTALDFSAEDGSQTPAAILFDHVDASAGDRPAVITKRHAEVKGPALTWPAGATTAQINTALAALETSLAIVSR